MTIDRSPFANLSSGRDCDAISKKRKWEEMSIKIYWIQLAQVDFLTDEQAE